MKTSQSRGRDWFQEEHPRRTLRESIQEELDKDTDEKTKEERSKSPTTRRTRYIIERREENIVSFSFQMSKISQI